MITKYKLKINGKSNNSAEIATLYQKAGISRKTLCSMFKQYSSTTIYRHAIKPIGQIAPFDVRRNSKGCPKILSIKDRHAILREIPKLRKSCGSFTSPRVEVEAGVEVKVSNWLSLFSIS